MIESFQIRKQLQDRGLFVDIIYEVEILEEADNNILIIYLADPKWETICKAGIIIFHDYFSTIKQNNIVVTVHEIKWLSVDTNNLIVFFATVKGLCKTLNIDNHKLKLDLESEFFQFPELRTFQNSQPHRTAVSQ